MRDLRALSILDAALNLSSTGAQAVQAITRAAAMLAQRGTVVAWCLDGGGEPVPGAVCFERADRRYMARFLEWQRAMPPAIRQQVATLAPRAIHAEPDQAGPEELDAMMFGPFSVYILANTGDGGGVHLAFSDPDIGGRPVLPSFGLDGLACHLASAWRVRQGVQRAHGALAGTAALDGSVGDPALREALRYAVARDLGRAQPRSTGDLELWDALLDGRWSLLDAFARAGTRYLVAHRNPPEPAEVVALRALPPLERTVLTLTLAGRAGKWIALDLQLSESTVTRALRMALARLGAGTTTALAGVQGARFELLDGVAGGVEIAAARLAEPAAAVPSLSQAERAIIGGLLGGKCIAAIAQERGTSSRTVANQVASTYRKLGVSSRRELLARLN
jgi:DNA-binding NarL/FixJ family response regulator